ncbi:MAG: hypothetical protein ACR2J3_10910 [Aridibacter sp.]
MSRKTNHTDIYVTSIIEDIQTRFTNEETLKFIEGREIEREYTFEDGAVIKYEWQDAPRSGSADKFNHRFTLITPPKPNPQKLKKGVIKEINYPY